MSKIATVNIKYIPDIFPGIDFSEKRYFSNFSLVKIQPIVTPTKTTDKWATYYDNSRFERIIQSEF